jgi:hypothetical protein
MGGLDEILLEDQTTQLEVVDFLAHFGVKGMKWGVRKNRGGVKTAKKTSTDHRRAQELKKRGPEALTNKQLKTINDRANLETNFRKHNPSPAQKQAAIGKAFIAALGVSGALSFASIVKWADSEHGKLAIKHAKKVIDKRKATKLLEATKLLPADAFIG